MNHLHSSLDITESNAILFVTQVGIGTPKAGHQAWPPACSWLRSAWRTHRRLPRSHQPSWKGLKCLHKPLRQVSLSCVWQCQRTDIRIFTVLPTHLMTVVVGIFLPMGNMANKIIWKMSANEPLCLIFFFAVLRRIKVTFIDTIIRIEHQPLALETGVALEVHIKR